jgi:hypothetical protein
VKKRLIVHIGVHKTGSTSMQQTFLLNAALFARHGILYPKYPSAPADAFNHQRLAWEIEMGTLDLVELRNWAESLAQLDAHTVILTSEDFSRLSNLEFLACFGDFFEVEVVIYLRRQDAWVTSWYNQHIKWPYDAVIARCNPVEFLGHLDEFHWIHYFDTIERWAKVVGKDRMHIRIMERGQIQDPIADMCDICGVDFLLENSLAKRANESLPAAQLRILRDLGIMQYSPDVRLMVMEAVRKIPAPPEIDVYPSAIRRMIMNRYAPGNGMVAEIYLGRKDRILFRDADFPDNAVGRENAPDDELLYGFARGLIEVFCPDAGREAPPATIAPTDAG